MATSLSFVGATLVNMRKRGVGSKKSKEESVTIYPLALNRKSIFIAKPV